jgi:hypothetical protein
VKKQKKKKIPLRTTRKFKCRNVTITGYSNEENGLSSTWIVLATNGKIDHCGIIGLKMDLAAYLNSII